MRLPVGEIKPNPNNPRLIKDDKFKKLVQSLKDFPEMAEVREVVVNKDHVILGGNMRFRAMKEAGWTDVPVKVVDWSEDKQREFVIKDNVSGGEWDWDILANEWKVEQLEEWGLDFPIYDEPDIDLPNGDKNGFQQMTFTLSDSQAETVKRAILKASESIDGTEDNENSNGNALFYLALAYVNR
jgi:hypothetical protein